MSMTDTYIESVFSAARALLREGCADAVSIYTSKNYGEHHWALHSRIGVRAEPERMTKDIALKLGSCFETEFSPVFSTKKSHILRSLYLDLNKLYGPDTPQIEDMRRKMAGETIEGDEESEDETDIALMPDEVLEAEGPEFNVARFSRDAAGPEELIVSRGGSDIFILSLHSDGIDIRSVLTKPQDSPDCRISVSLPPDISDTPRKERLRIVRNWLRGYLPDEPLRSIISERHEVDTPHDDSSLFYWIKEFGIYCLPGQIRIRDPLASHSDYYDDLCFKDNLSESSKLETMVGKSIAELMDQQDFPYHTLFPGQGSGFPATYAGGRIFSQSGLEDDHYVMLAHPEHRENLIGRFFMLRLAELMGIPAVNAAWSGERPHEALILRRFDVRNGRAAWRESAAQAGKAAKDILCAEDVRRLYRRSILGRIAGFAWRNFDLVEFQPNSYIVRNLKEIGTRIDERPEIRLAPFIGAAPKNTGEFMLETARRLMRHAHDPVAEELGLPAPEAADMRARLMRTPVDALATTLAWEFPVLRKEIAALAQNIGNAFAEIRTAGTNRHAQ